MIAALIASIFSAFDLIITKKVFNIFKNLSFKTFSLWIFIFIIVVGLIVSPWFVQIDVPIAVTPHFLWLLLIMAFLSANYNLLYYFGLRYEKLSDIEPFLLFDPIVTILIASLFYADERFWQLYVAAFIAGGFLAWSHIEKRHIKLGKPLLAILGFSILAGLEAVVIKQLLIVYSPTALYLVRAIIVALFLWIVQKGRIVPITIKQIPFFLLIASLAVLIQSLIYSAYHNIGVSLTEFILLLSPILVYGLSSIVLKEKLGWKNLVTSAVVIALIIWVILIK